MPACEIMMASLLELSGVWDGLDGKGNCRDGGLDMARGMEEPDNGWKTGLYHELFSIDLGK